MSYSEDSDQGWKVEEKVYKTEPNSAERKDSQRQTVPRFLEKWLLIFDPWVTRSRDDPNKPFCKACQTSLDCNRAHLQRHERTTKHEKNLKIFIENGEQAALDNFHLRQERNKYYFQRKMKQLDKDNETTDFAEGEYMEGEEMEEEPAIEYIKTDIARYNRDLYTRKPNVKQLMNNSKMHSQVGNISKATIKRIPPAAASKKDRIKLFMQIQKDKNDLMKTFRDLIRTNNSAQVQPPPPPQQEKNHVDLFFESVSSTVKTLSPKLIAEAKMRVQQLICELELRELTEGNTNASGESLSSGTILVSPSSGNSYVLQTNEHVQQPYTTSP